MESYGEKSEFAVMALSGLSHVGLLLAQSAPLLIVQTATGSTSFHLGERISLNLSFSSSSVNQFEINLARYDRSGRMHSEQFGVSPGTDGKIHSLHPLQMNMWAEA